MNEQEKHDEFNQNLQQGVYNAAVHGTIDQMELHVKIVQEGKETTKNVRIIFLPDPVDMRRIQVHQDLSHLTQPMSPVIHTADMAPITGPEPIALGDQPLQGINEIPDKLRKKH